MQLFEATLQERRLAGRHASTADVAGPSHRPDEEPVSDMERTTRMVYSTDEEMSDAVANWDTDVE